jgi:hypothetical protein
VKAKAVERNETPYSLTVVLPVGKFQELADSIEEAKRHTGKAAKTRRLALRLAVELAGHTRSGSDQTIVVAQKFEKYLRGDEE